MRSGAPEAAVVAVVDPEARSRLCESILRSLPEWFGIESAVDEYVRAVADLPAFAIGEDAFLALKVHNEFSAEVYVMGVRRELHGRGLGRALLRVAEEHVRSHGIEYLHVKTLGPSHPSEHYARTRAFYERCGFAPLEEIHGLWDEGNPCLIMVTRITP